jgi:hypothetical protein
MPQPVYQQRVDLIRRAKREMLLTQTIWTRITNDDSDGPATMVFGPVPVPVPPPVPDPVPVTPLPVVVVLPEVVGMVPVPRTMQAAAVHEPVPVVVVMTTPLLTVTVFVIVSDEARLMPHIDAPPQDGRAPAVI